MWRLWRMLRDRTGASLLETGIALPFMLILGVGVIEYGNALNVQHQITTGVRDAARFLARHHDPVAAEAAAKLLATTGSVTGGEARVSGWSIGDIAITYRELANPIDPETGERTYRGGDPIRIVHVSATMSYQGMGGLNFLGTGSALSLHVAHEERVIGE